MKCWWVAALTSVGLAACGGSSPSGPARTPPVAADAVLLAAGDIGYCGVSEPEATGRLLDANPGQVAALGDIAYPTGSTTDIQNCYEPHWGRHKARTHPVPGNHDHINPGASAYYAYFGDAAGPAGRGYYSYTLESWHAVALDSSIPMDPNSAQFAWLVEDLRANPSACTIAYWHHPLFTSGKSQGYPRTREVWRALYAAGADLVLAADDHGYERFSLQDPDGHPDPSLGIRQFTVGTGGAPLYDVSGAAANSEVRSKTHGVLRLTLKPGKYDWEFIPIAGKSFRDFGSGLCH